VRGEFNISGLQNKTLRLHLPDLSSSQVSRLIKRLRTHGLIKKVGQLIQINRGRIRDVQKLAFERF
jgi:hypothetical protein